MTEEEFDRIFVEAIDLVDGPHPEKSVQLLKDLIVRACEELPLNDKTVITLRMYLGRAMWRSDLAAQATPILESALADAEATLGWQNRLTFSCAGNLCRALGGVDRFQEAIDLATTIYSRRITAFGKLDNGTLNSLGHLSQLMAEVGNLPKAIELMSSLYIKRCEAFGEDDERSRSSRYNVIAFRARLRNDEQALLDLLTECSAEYGNDSPYTINIWAEIAHLFEITGQLEEALEVWREVEQRRHKVFGEVAVPTLNAVVRCLLVQQALGYPDVEVHLEIARRTRARIKKVPVAGG